MSDEKKTYSDEVKTKYERIVKVFEDFDPEGVTILTGNNGSGKSLFRKQLPFAFKQYYDLEKVEDTKGMIKSTSMDARTESRPDFGALSSIMHDTSWIATSQNTLNHIRKLLDAVENSDSTKYVVIDEYEIGCSEETILALAEYISGRIQKLLADRKIIGAMIITHSRLGVKTIKHDHFVNIEGLTEKQWLTRKVQPTDLAKLEENELFFYIRDNKK